MTDDSISRRKRELLIDLGLLAIIPTVVGIVVGIATFSRVTSIPATDTPIAVGPIPPTSLSSDGQTTNSPMVESIERSPIKQPGDIRSACLKAGFVAILITLCATVPGVLLPYMLEGAAMPLATIVWRIPPTFGGLALARWWDEPERNCFLSVLLACYFTALVLESGLLIRRLSVGRQPVTVRGQD